MSAYIPERRFENTIRFLGETLQPPARILDLGVANMLSTRLQDIGYQMENTGGEDLDFETGVVKQTGFDAVTAFEILEHLVSPLQVLKSIEAPRLFASIPMRLWFAPAYRSSTDPWDRHYHEFEDWQFDWLLEKAGWKIVRSEKWASPARSIGVRPLLRLVTPRYYIVEAVRG